MNRLKISGGIPLAGEIEAEGSKNAVLPILAASILNSGISEIHGVPGLSDVYAMIDILKDTGCKISFSNHIVTIDSSDMKSTIISEILAKKMRSSIILMGALLGRFGEAIMPYPGGCELGPRPIDLHLKGLRQLGVETYDSGTGQIVCKAKQMIGAEIQLDYPSVGATENIMLSACCAKGNTIIRNAAREPEIKDLQNFLKAMGFKITGAGTNTINIKGEKKNNLKSEVVHKVIPDRIVTGTYLIAGAITRGEVVVRNVCYENISSIVNYLRESGCKIKLYNCNTIEIKTGKKTFSVDLIRTLPYPGFPTDMQPQMTAYLSKTKGTSIMIETVFDNRYNYIEQLIWMGADITVNGRVAVIKGVDKLIGNNIESKDLRGGAALVLAGLAAESNTLIKGVEFIDRGYENIENTLTQLGAKIERI